MTIEMLPVKSLKLLHRNPRKIAKDQFEKLCNSIKEDPNFFNARPCLVNHIVESNIMVVYAGNQRVLAAKKLGWEKVPCIVEKDLSEEIMKSRVIKDNKHYGTWDDDILFADFEVDLLTSAGFSNEELTGDYPETPSKGKKVKKTKKLEKQKKATGNRPKKPHRNPTPLICELIYKVADGLAAP